MPSAVHSRMCLGSFVCLRPISELKEAISCVALEPSQEIQLTKIVKISKEVKRRTLQAIKCVAFHVF